MKELKRIIIAVDGYSEITAQHVIDGEAGFQTFLNNITGCYTFEEKKEPTTVENGALTGKYFVFTGFRDVDAQAIIESAGGEVGSSVNSKTTYLVAKDTSKQTGKMKKAADKGVIIIDRAEMMEMINA